MQKRLKKRPVIAYLAHSLVGDYHMKQWLALHEYAIEKDVSLHFFSPFLFYTQRNNREGYFRTFELADPENVDALIVSGASLDVFFPPERLDVLYERFLDIPVVNIATEQAGVPAVIINNRKGFYDLTEHMIVEHKYRTFAFIKGTEGNIDAQVRFEAFQECLKNHGIPIREDLLIQGNFGYVSGQKAIEEIYDVRKQKPDVILCANDDMARGALEALTLRGIRVPQDVALAGYDNIEAAAHSSTPLTTVSQGILEQAQKALELILEMLEGKRVPLRTEMPSEVIVRQSCGCSAEKPAASIEASNSEEIQYKAHELMNEKGYNLGQLTSFSKNVMETLSLGALHEQLQTLCAGMHLSTLFIALYNKGSPQSPQSPKLPESADVFFCLIDGKMWDLPLTFHVSQLLGWPEEFGKKRRTMVISEFVFQNEHYGYFVGEMSMPDPVLFHMINLEVSNCLRNISVKRQMDSAYQKLEELDTLKNEFIANITHDFRSPLTITLGTSEMGMQDTPEGSEDRQRYQVIYEASLKLKSTIDRFLELTRMDNRGLRIHVAELRLCEYIRDIASFYRSSLLKSNIQVRTETPPYEIEDLFSDKEKLEEILNNLISNALKFVDPEKGSITISVQDDLSSVHIHVVDNGVGIPHDQLEAIFERFTQLAPSRNHRTRGTGIGLAFSRQLASYLHGTLSAYSAGPGLGSTFTMTLPKGKSHFSTEDMEKENDRLRSIESNRSEVRSLLQLQLKERTPHSTVVELPQPTQDGDDDIKNATILIVEDSPAILELERKYLASSGYKNFVLAQDGKQGLAAAYLYHPDLIICDVNMPGMRGDELYEQLTLNPEFAKTPFIFVSAVSEREFIVDLRKRGVEAFLSKPIDSTEMILTADLHLRGVYDMKRALKTSQVDELTGLFSRRNLSNQIQMHFSNRSFRDSSFIFIDVDHFKAVNDTYGHPVGDKVLAAIGRCIKDNLRPYDISGRYGGEEFLLLLPDTNLKDAVKTADKLRRLVSEIVVSSEGKSIAVTASFGVSSLKEQAKHLPSFRGTDELQALFEPPSGNIVDWKKRDVDIRQIVDELIELADQGLYEAKKAGRNRVIFIQ